jgi:predicted type IV restriction endonuclease
MEFIDQLRAFATRVSKLKEQVQTEEATKTSLVMPFFSLLGYDVFNPLEFIPEFTADVGIKKGEKVDYAIMKDGTPTILIEAKATCENLDRHGGQLFRYFGTTTAKFGILTNGVDYRFYTDLDEPNKMDQKPFFSINLLDLRDQEMNELKKFQKSTFDVEQVFNNAEDLKYTNQIKLFLSRQFEDPELDFTSYIVGSIYPGRRTQAILDKFKPVVKKSMSQFIGDLVNDRIKAALNQAQPNNDKQNDNDVNNDITTLESEPVSKINTIQDELEAFAIIKVLLRDILPFNKISYKDTESYFGILYENNTRKWICRLKLETSKKYIILPDENKKPQSYPLESINDIFQYADRLAKIVTEYMQNKELTIKQGETCMNLKS